MVCWSERYEALNPRGKRKAIVQIYNAPENILLPELSRQQLGQALGDQYRNSAPAAWAIEKMLDYVTMQTLQVTTSDRKFNEAFEEEFAEWAETADYGGVHSFDKMIELAARCMFLSGDSGLLMVKGYQLQGIESDRICKPTLVGTLPATMPASLKDCTDDGLILDKTGKILYYVICSWMPNSATKQFNALVRPRDFCYLGNFFRFDQARGISPAACGYTTFQDVGEVDEAMRVKAKIEAMAVMKFSSSDDTPDGDNIISAELQCDPADTTPIDGDEPPPETAFDLLAMDVGTKVELAPGESMDLIAPQSPNPQYEPFMVAELRKGFNAWGIPYSIWDSSKANYASMRVDRLELSRTAYRRWLPQIIASRRRVFKFVLPEILARLAEYGIKPPEGKITHEWITDSDPWIDELNEAKAAGERIDRGLSNHILEARRRGLNAYRVADQEAAYREYIKTLGIPLVTGQPGSNIEKNEPTGMARENGNNPNP
ncbi:MAG: phage portal protein [Victivallaceae bacterium]